MKLTGLHRSLRNDRSRPTGGERGHQDRPRSRSEERYGDGNYKDTPEAFAKENASWGKAAESRSVRIGRLSDERIVQDSPTGGRLLPCFAQHKPNCGCLQANATWWP
jgi:hypothetical protein